jgi:hypothetical protein
MDSDAQAWNLLLALTALTTATLVLVVVDKPFRDPHRPDWEGITLPDKLMIVAQVSQLVNYGVAAVCLQDKESRLLEGEFGTSDGIALFAAVTGFLMVGIQVGGLLYAYRKERKKNADETEEDEEGSGATDGAVQETANPLEAGDEADETE